MGCQQSRFDDGRVFVRSQLSSRRSRGSTLEELRAENLLHERSLPSRGCQSLRRSLSRSSSRRKHKRSKSSDTTKDIGAAEAPGYEAMASKQGGHQKSFSKNTWSSMMAATVTPQTGDDVGRVAGDKELLDEKVSILEPSIHTDLTKYNLSKMASTPWLVVRAIAEEQAGIRQPGIDIFGRSDFHDLLIPDRALRTPSQLHLPQLSNSSGPYTSHETDIVARHHQHSSSVHKSPSAHSEEFGAGRASALLNNESIEELPVPELPAQHIPAIAPNMRMQVGTDLLQEIGSAFSRPRDSIGHGLGLLGDPFMTDAEEKKITSRRPSTQSARRPSGSAGRPSMSSVRASAERQRRPSDGKIGSAREPLLRTTQDALVRAETPTAMFGWLVPPKTHVAARPHSGTFFMSKELESGSDSDSPRVDRGRLNKPLPARPSNLSLYYDNLAPSPPQSIKSDDSFTPPRSRSSSVVSIISTSHFPTAPSTPMALSRAQSYQALAPTTQTHTITQSRSHGPSIFEALQSVNAPSSPAHSRRPSDIAGHRSRSVSNAALRAQPSPAPAIPAPPAPINTSGSSPTSAVGSVPMHRRDLVLHLQHSASLRKSRARQRELERSKSARSSGERPSISMPRMIDIRPGPRSAPPERAGLGDEVAHGSTSRPGTAESNHDFNDFFFNDAKTLPGIQHSPNPGTALFSPATTGPAAQAANALEGMRRSATVPRSRAGGIMQETADASAAAGPSQMMSIPRKPIAGTTVKKNYGFGVVGARRQSEMEKRRVVGVAV